MRISVRNSIWIATLVRACLAGLASHSAEVAEVWEGRPYRIAVSLAVEAPGDLARQLAEQLPTYLSERASTSIGNIWQMDVQSAKNALRHQLLYDFATLTDEDLPAVQDGEDKRLLLAVRVTPWGYELSAREFDRYLQRWGPPIHRKVRQCDAVSEQLFTLARQAIAPLARIVPDAEDPQKVVIELRGADLPLAGAGDFRWLEPGDVLQPQLVRKSRDGAVAPDGVTVVPWTYIEVAEPEEGAARPMGNLRSATARPLGARRGRVELLAIGMRHDRQPSALDLRSRADLKKPLSGYEVFTQSRDGKELKLVGASDASGAVLVPPGETAVEMLYLKSGGVTLGRMPLVPGAEPRVTVPLPDDELRLKVAARLAAMREDIVDVVARRTIFMARVRQQIEESNFEAARELMRSLDALPGVTQFRLTLERDAQLLHTSDVQVQRRIDKLFSETRGALGKFLNPQPIGALHEELRQAELRSKEAKGGEDAS